MNMERSIPNNDAQNPLSPKKRLHTKDKSSLTDSIANARASLKSGKDISARNLMECTAVRKPLARQASLEFDADLAKDASESSADEIVALDEDHTDFTSACAADGFNGYVDDDDDDDDDTIEEEIIEEYYEEEVIDDASLESLPPPIVIPKSLQVKDSDDEKDDEDEDSDDDSDTYDDDDSNPVVVAQPITKQQRSKIVSSTPTTKPNVTNAAKATKPLMKNASVETETPKSSTSPVVAVASPEPAAAHSPSVQPEQTKSEVPSTIDLDNEIDRKVTSSESQRNHNDAANEDSAASESVWEKPDWTKNNRLKSTGISPARNLAKPITQLPELVSKKEMNDIKTPKKSNTMQSKLSLDNTKAASIMTYPKSPAKSIAKKASMPSISAPKSAPQQDGGRPKLQVSTPVPTAKDDNDDDFASKIGWEKPEWATKKVLRKTAKTETILSGGKLERPIGGIRPIE